MGAFNLVGVSSEALWLAPHFAEPLKASPLGLRTRRGAWYCSLPHGTGGRVHCTKTQNRNKV